MKEPKELGFVLEEIPLQEAQILAMSGSGKYADIILMLAKKLPEMESANESQALQNRMTLAFGMPKGEVLDDKARRSLLVAINKSFPKQGLSWVLRYSENRKQFICVPKKANPSNARKPQTPTEPNRPEQTQKYTKGFGRLSPEQVAQIHELYKQDFTQSEISRRMGISRPVINRAIIKLEGPVRAKPKEAPTKITPQEFVSLTREVLNGEDRRMINQALSIVGVKDLFFKGRELGPAIGISQRGVSWNARNPNKRNDRAISILRQALQEKGII